MERMLVERKSLLPPPLSRHPPGPIKDFIILDFDALMCAAVNLVRDAHENF
jgi:hypothetical protein